jgi:Double sensory domain of two-component sensor kinase
LRVFIQSWDKSAYDTPLESFRKGLVLVKNTEKPFVSIELGKKLNIKAIVPITHGNEYVGSLEVIKNFDEIVEYFKSKDVSLFVLMDKKHLAVAEWMVDYPMLKEFVVCHRSFDNAVMEELKTQNIYAKAGYRTVQGENYFLAFEPLRDMDGQKLGFFVLAMPKADALKLSKTPDKLSFFTNYSKDEIESYYKQDVSSKESKSANKLERKYGEIK